LVHRWGWTITLNPDGTTTMTSPHGRTLHSHSPGLSEILCVMSGVAFMAGM
jgi:hypothetical protein